MKRLWIYPPRCGKATLVVLWFAALIFSGAKCLALANVTAGNAENPGTETMYLSGTDKDHRVPWQFFCTDGARSGQWTTIDVPSCWELEGFGHYNYGHDRPPYDEQGIYRTTFSLPSRWEHRRVFIVFEGVMTDAEVLINGELAGPIHQGAFYRFKYDISDIVRRQGENSLEVTVSKESSNQSINEAERRADYWIFGGIYRPVYLEAQPSVFIDHVAIDARHTGELHADVLVNGAKGLQYTVDVAILDEEGQQVGKSQQVGLRADSAQLALSVRSPKTWTSETPWLYTACFNLYLDGHKVHSVKQKFGFRTIEFREQDGFYVNGVKIKFKGVDRHTFWPESGRTISKALAVEDVNLIKEMNMNAVRMSHYPPDSYFLDACDSLGLYVIDELTGWQSAYDSISACRLVREMIERDVNHPSIVIWANGNEGGFPKAARPWYKRLDIQQRQVVEPWSRYDGTDTHHYPRFGPAKERATRGDVVYMPTESLHGLHDGGHGAGLEDYWEMIRTTPTAAGQFLWDFADEGVVRHDLNDSIDVFKDKAPDGILGPHHEKEGSFFTIREVWSPIHVEAPQFDTFDGTLTISNRYHFTNLRDCRFSASLINYPLPMDATQRQVQLLNVASPDVAPWTENAQLKIDLPADWRTSDVLTLTATDPHGRELYTWTWPIAKPAQFTARLLPEHLKPLKGKRAKAAIEAAESILHPRFVGIDTANATMRWTALSDGWLRLDYSFVLDGDYDIAGITFDYDEADVTGASLLADGPYRVWKNRMKGVSYGLHQKAYNNTITGQSWDYPEFKGYYAHFTAMQLHGHNRQLTLLSPTEGIFLHLFTPERPQYMSKNVDPTFPEGQLSLLLCIPAIGTKFSRAEDEGPQGTKAHFDHYKVEATAYLKLDQTAADNAMSDSRPLFLVHPELSASQNTAYRTPTRELTPPPAGKHPFHISHYGRHGSRYMIEQHQYDEPFNILSEAADSSRLTSAGQRALMIVGRMRQEAEGRLGELTPLGAQQHREIARRMGERFPEVFVGEESWVDARSTIVVRCILSMENELLGLQSLFPHLRISHDASQHDMAFMNIHDRALQAKRRPEAVRREQEDFNRRHEYHAHLMQTLFNDSGYVARRVNQPQLNYLLFRLASNLQNCESRHDMTLYDLFSDEEIYGNWSMQNASWFIDHGFYSKNGAMQPTSQRALLRRIIADADSCIALPASGAMLRFGHDSTVMPLVCLMGLNGFGKMQDSLEELDARGWRNYEAIPMAANIQLVFYRSSPADEDVMVKVLLNEEEATLPFDSPTAPYYLWRELRQKLLQACET